MRTPKRVNLKVIDSRVNQSFFLKYILHNEPISPLKENSTYIHLFFPLIFFVLLFVTLFASADSFTDTCTVPQESLKKTIEVLLHHNVFQEMIVTDTVQ